MLRTDETESFHAGERALQARAGVAERLARVGAQVIRGQMPEQHRQFFELLPFIVVGSIDAHMQPTASLLAAPSGFVSSPHPELLRVDAMPRRDDPLHDNLRAGAPLAVLGIQPHTRRRNRVNGNVQRLDELGFTLAVRQSFGNCPKYIHPREAVYVGPRGRGAALSSERLGEAERALIRRADTFFIASAHPEALSGAAPRSHGVDVSHRGGPPGFAHFIDDETFIVPDFRGNNFYSTLGNLLLQPAAGLLFIDVASGDVLELEASAEALTGTHPATEAADTKATSAEAASAEAASAEAASAEAASAEAASTGRIVRFVVHRARLFPGASALRFIAPTDTLDPRVR